MNVQHAYTRSFEEAGGQINMMAPAPKTYAEFYSRDVLKPGETDKAGYPVYMQMDFVKIHIPGDPGNVVDRKVQEADKLMHAAAWAAYQKQEAFAVDGILLENWPPIDKNTIGRLKANGIYTVQHLAGLRDDLLNVVLGGRTLRDKAAAWLEAAERGAMPVALVSENESLKAKISLLERQMSELIAASDDLRRRVMTSDKVASVPEPTKLVEAIAAQEEASTDWSKRSRKEVFQAYRSRFGITPDSVEAAIEALSSKV